jgi:hypothetical protein
MDALVHFEQLVVLVFVLIENKVFSFSKFIEIIFYYFHNRKIIQYVVRKFKSI